MPITQFRLFAILQAARAFDQALGSLCQSIRGMRRRANAQNWQDELNELNIVADALVNSVQRAGTTIDQELWRYHATAKRNDAERRRKARRRNEAHSGFNLDEALAARTLAYGDQLDDEAAARAAMVKWDIHNEPDMDEAGQAWGFIPAGTVGPNASGGGFASGSQPPGQDLPIDLAGAPTPPSPERQESIMREVERAARRTELQQKMAYLLDLVPAVAEPPALGNAPNPGQASPPTGQNKFTSGG